MRATLGLIALVAVLLLAPSAWAQDGAKKQTGSIRLMVEPTNVFVKARAVGRDPFVPHKLRADGDGEYLATGLPPHNYLIDVFARWHVRAAVRHVAVKAGEEARVSISLRPAGRISGKVTPPESRACIGALKAGTAGVVEVGRASRRTGEYVIDGLPPGKYDLIAVPAEGKGTAMRGVQVPEGTPRPEDDAAIRQVLAAKGRAESTPGDWGRTLELMSPNYRDALGQDYKDYLEMGEALRKQKQRAEAQGGESEEKFMFTYDVLRTWGAETGASTFYRRTMTVINIASGKKHYDVTRWGLLKFEKLQGRWLIVWEGPMEPLGLDTDELAVDTGGKMAGIVVKAGEVREGHDISIPSR